MDLTFFAVAVTAVRRLAVSASPFHNTARRIDAYPSSNR